MSVFLATANFSTLLNGSITNSAVTINVTPGSGALIPTIRAGEVVSATLVDSATRSVFETIHITSVVTDALTVVRAQDGSSAHAYASGDILFIGMTAEDYRACVQADQLQAGTYSKATASGTANALTATVSSSLTAVPDGLHITVMAAAANTGAATLNLTLGTTVIGALPIIKQESTALVAGDIPAAGYPLDLVYSATAASFVLLNPGTNPPQATVQGAHKNLGISTTGTDTNVTLTADELVLGDGAGNYKTVRGVSLVVNTAGTVGQPLSLSTGALAASTFYAVWVWNNGTTTTATIDPSDTTPTAPAGYTGGTRARFGWVLTDGTVNKHPLPILQEGRIVNFRPASGTNLTNYANVASGVVTGTVSLTGYIPPNVKRFILRAGFSNGNPVSVSIGGVTMYSFDAGAGLVFQFAAFDIVRNTRSIDVNLGGASSQIAVIGWEDNL